MEAKNFRDLSIEVLKNMPEGATLEEVMQKIRLTAQVLKGLEDEEKGRVLTGDQLRKNIKSWTFRK